MKKYSAHIVLLVVTLLCACSTEKNAFPNKFYHGLTTRYNVYYNANEKLKSAEASLYKKHIDDYDQLLEIYPYGSDAAAKEVTPDLDVAIKKASKAIAKHSMRFKIKRKGESKTEDTEVNPFIDDSYFVLAKAYFFKREYKEAAETFEYIAKEYHYKKIKYDALIWLIKTYIAAEQYEEARQKIDLLQADKNLPKAKKSDYFAVRAAYFIRTNDHKEAVKALQEAVLFSKKGKNKHRWTYTLAQLYLQNHQYKEAVLNFKKVADASVKYEMEFNARIHMALCHTEGQSVEGYIRDLMKLAKDEKNKEYLDQIHFAIAQLYLKEKEKEKAAEHFLLAAHNSTNNPKQKALAFLALADMNFAKSNYVTASAYYDSTMLVLPATHPAYDKTLIKKNSLTDIVKQVEIIHTQDSLQQLASLPEPQRLKKIDKMIAAVSEKEDRASEQIMLKEAAATQQALNEPSDANAKWYFYNPKLISGGQAKFTVIWGQRTLEDNWRRKSKVSAAFGADTDDAQSNSNTTASSDNKKTREYYLSALPLTDTALALSKSKMIDAYFKLGALYKDNLEDDAAAIKTFEEMNSKFPNNSNALKSYYLLYRAHLKLGQIDKANHYKTLINNDFPNSEYAALLNKKDDSKEEAQQKAHVNAQHEQLLAEYKAGHFAAVITEVQNINAAYKNNALEAQFELLKAFAIGQTKGVEEFKKALLLVKSGYVGSDAANSAADVIANMSAAAPASNPKIYTANKTEEHYFIVIADENTSDVKALEKNISDFCTKYYALENLQQQSIIWEESKKAIVIKTFRKNETMMDFYKSINTNVLSTYPNIGKDYFPISVTNYVAFYKNKNVTQYYDFFVSEYTQK